MIRRLLAALPWVVARREDLARLDGEILALRMLVQVYQSRAANAGR